MSAPSSHPDRLYALLTEGARDAGFPLSGALDLDTVLGPGGAYEEHASRYEEWVRAGYAAEMEYLVRGLDRRKDPRLVFPPAQSVLSVAVPYPRRPAGASNPARGPRYARYLQGPDYHKTIAARLESLMTTVAAAYPIPLTWKVCVDTSAVLERSWAALAGLGWIGKNTLLIHPKHGSYLFLAEVLLSEKVGRGPAPLANYCGNCTRCLDACPTRAFARPGQLDSNRCISYWTLEKRGEIALSEADRRAIGPWVAGCDICQEVCPFNLKPARAEAAAPPPLESGATAIADWEALERETEEEYRARVRDSALKRVKPEQFKRNLEIAKKNR